MEFHDPGEASQGYLGWKYNGLASVANFAHGDTFWDAADAKAPEHDAPADAPPSSPATKKKKAAKKGKAAGEHSTSS